MEAIRLESVWENNLIKHKWSETAILKYNSYLAKSSIEQYNNYLGQFQDFCLNSVGTFPPPQDLISATIAEFLVYKSELSERPESMLKTISAAISNYYLSCFQFNPFTVELKNLMKSLIRCETTRPSGRTKIMPIEPIIKLFESWGPNNCLDIARLRKKCICLLALSCMARPSDFAPEAGFKRNQISFNADGSATILFFGVKNDASRTGFETRVEADKNVLRDPVSCLKAYFARTNPTDDSVFVTITKPETGLSAARIAQIMKAGISDSGLPTNKFSARSYRPSSATAAILSGCNPETTRLRGRWKENTTFQNRYVYPISVENITENILASNVEL